MSSYVNFWVAKNEQPILINWGCRSSELYQFFEDFLPWERCVKLDKNFTHNCKLELQFQFEQNDKSIGDKQDEIGFLKGSSLSGDELMENFYDCQSMLNSLFIEKEELKKIKWFLELIDSILDDQIEVWAGIECYPPYHKEEEENDIG